MEAAPPSPSSPTGSSRRSSRRRRRPAARTSRSAAAPKSIQQYLAAGLVDEMLLNVVPVLLGGGARLFDEPRRRARPSSRCEAVEAPGVTHLKYRRAGCLDLDPGARSARGCGPASRRSGSRSPRTRGCGRRPRAAAASPRSPAAGPGCRSGRRRRWCRSGPAGRRVEDEHALLGAGREHLGRRLVVEVEAPVPGRDRDAGAEAVELDAVDRRAARRAGRSRRPSPAAASRSASSVSLLPGTRTVGVSIAARASIVSSSPSWIEAKSPAPITTSASADISTSSAAWPRSRCRSLKASSLTPPNLAARRPAAAGSARASAAPAPVQSLGGRSRGASARTRVLLEPSDWGIARISTDNVARAHA